MKINKKIVNTTDTQDLQTLKLPDTDFKITVFTMLKQMKNKISEFQ